MENNVNSLLDEVNLCTFDIDDDGLQAQGANSNLLIDLAEPLSRIHHKNI